MTPELAIHIVARQLTANAAREVEWEQIPDIGEQDFLWLMEVLVALNPEMADFNEALTLLEKRAAGWLVEVGRDTE